MTALEFWFELNRHYFDENLMHKLDAIPDERERATAWRYYIGEVLNDFRADWDSADAEIKRLREETDALVKTLLIKDAPKIINDLYSETGSLELTKQLLRERYGQVIRDSGLQHFFNQEYAKLKQPV